MPTWRGKSSRRRTDDSPRARGSISLDALYLNAEQNVLLESVLLAVVHAEVRAIEAAARVGAADLLLEHGMLDAFERIDAEGHRLGHAVERQLAADRLGCSIREIQELTLVFRRR